MKGYSVLFLKHWEGTESTKSKFRLHNIIKTDKNIQVKTYRDRVEKDKS